MRFAQDGGLQVRGYGKIEAIAIANIARATEDNKQTW
jgi:hypothetical protein